MNSALEAKFSVQYCVSRALMHGKVMIDHFEGDAWADSEAQRLLKLVTAGPHPTMTDKPWCAEVIVETVDGKKLSERTEYLMGRGKPNPMSETVMRVKFEDCVSRILPSDQTARLFDMLGSFERIRNMRDLTALCVAPASASSAAAE